MATTRRARLGVIVFVAFCGDLFVGASGLGCSPKTETERLTSHLQDGAKSAVAITTKVEANRCPVLTSWTVSPLQTSFPGGAIDVRASATDDDVGVVRGEVLSFTWSPSSKFRDPHAPTTTYHCTAVGADTITVRVSDNHAPDPCSASISVPVTCVDSRAPNRRPRS